MTGRNGFSLEQYLSLGYSPHSIKHLQDFRPPRSDQPEQSQDLTPVQAERNIMHQPAVAYSLGGENFLFHGGNRPRGSHGHLAARHIGDDASTAGFRRPAGH